MIKKIRDLNINYIDENKEKEETIFLIHGWGASLDYFLDTINLLKVKYRVVALDLPGFGKSDDLKRAFCVDDYCDIVLDFIKDLNIKNVIFLGHSYGGRIIIKLNNRKDLPFIIEKNILIDSAGIIPKRSLKYYFKVFSFKLGKNLINILPIKNKEEIIENMRRKNGSSDYKNASPLLRETMVKSVNEDLKDLIKNIKNETLIIWGEDDKETPLSDGKFMEKNIKNSGLCILKGTGHFSFLEDRNTYLRILSSYLKI